MDSEGNVTLQFAIQTDIEQRIVKLEKTQLEQDDAISEIMFGGEDDE